MAFFAGKSPEPSFRRREDLMLCACWSRAEGTSVRMRSASGCRPHHLILLPKKARINNMCAFKNALCLEQIPEASYSGLSIRHRLCQRRDGHEGAHRSYSRTWWTLDQESVGRNVAAARDVMRRLTATQEDAK